MKLDSSGDCIWSDVHPLQLLNHHHAVLGRVFQHQLQKYIFCLSSFRTRRFVYDMEFNLKVCHHLAHDRPIDEGVGVVLSHHCLCHEVVERGKPVWK